MIKEHFLSELEFTYDRKQKCYYALDRVFRVKIRNQADTFHLVIQCIFAPSPTLSLNTWKEKGDICIYLDPSNRYQEALEFFAKQDYLPAILMKRKRMLRLLLA